MSSITASSGCRTRPPAPGTAGWSSTALTALAVAGTDRHVGGRPGRRRPRPWVTDAASNALQTSAKTMTQAADSPVKDAAAGPGGGDVVDDGASSVSSARCSGRSPAGQQLPQMLSQAPQMLSGHAGPIEFRMGGIERGLRRARSPPKPPARCGGGPGIGGLGALAGGGGGGADERNPRPGKQFRATREQFQRPTSPTLPGGWRAAPEPGGAGQAAHRAGMGGGGLYGAPPRWAATGNSECRAKPTRTMQVTARPGADRGERQRI